MWVLMFVSAWYLLLAAKKIFFLTADLGRHLSNGRHLLLHPELLSQNFYSYSYPNFPFLNHHWGSGLVFYGVEHFFGFPGLSCLNLLLCVSALAVLSLASLKKSGTFAVCSAALFVVPLFAQRTEIRPESFSYFFSALFYLFLSHYRNKKRIYLLPLFMLLWVNLHIYFVFGFFLLTCFILEDFFTEKKINTELTRIFSLCLIASLVNPIGYRLVLYPLQIFQNYGYQVLENQPAWFIFHRGLDPYSLLPLGLLGLLLGGGATLCAFQKRKLRFSSILLASAFFVLACLAIRNTSIFALFSLPLLSEIFAARKKLFLAPFFALALALNVFYGVKTANPGIGLEPNSEGSALFFLENGLHGPIFNNYDIGSYLIYSLFPQEKVFVDNRPEAYPSSFFTDIYIPMQESEDKWRRAETDYHFNVIFFYWRDLTPWAQSFLLRRVRDPEWVPVYVDNAALIFLKNVPENSALIQRFQLSRDIFKVR